ncbi:MAG TPA: transcription antitermination factor NusB [Candidatus Aphodovivens excrementavium]|nr:transcription antitermination factor NusB [Candidatus Aphodovivens excrementavium]
MATKRHQRTAARRAALALLYTSEITEEHATTIAEEGRALEEAGPLTDYAQRLVKGVESHIATIDKELAATAENWSVHRMPIVDRSILRLAVYEMMFVDEVPVSVSINEAIELAKDFGGEDESPRFINGVLGRIARRQESASAAEPASDAAEPSSDQAAVEEDAQRDL